MVLFDLADAPWFPLLMVLVTGAVVFLLFLNMRRELRRIRLPRNVPGPPESPAEQ